MAGHKTSSAQGLTGVETETAVYGKRPGESEFTESAIPNEVWKLSLAQRPFVLKLPVNTRRTMDPFVDSRLLFLDDLRR